MRFIQHLAARFFVVVMIMGVCSGIALYGQNDSATTDVPARAGTKALQFGFQGLQLSGSPGGKYWKTEHSAFAVFLTLSGDIGSPAEIITTIDTSIREYELKKNWDEFSIGLSGEYQYHLFPRSKISPFVGVGTGVTFSFGHATLTNPKMDYHVSANYPLKKLYFYLYAPPNGEVDFSYTMLNINSYGIFGVEYFITPILSLTGQVTFGLSAQYSKKYEETIFVKDTRRTQIEYTDAGWTFGFSTGIGALTLSIYF